MALICAIVKLILLSMPTAIITGSLGLVGSHVANVLSNCGFRIVGIDCDVRSSLFTDVSPLSASDINSLNHKSSVDQHYSVDIRDSELVANVIESELSSNDVALIVHCAAQPSHDWASSAPLVDLNINLVGTINILENLRVRNYTGLFVFLSTNKVYGDLPNYLPLIEDDTRFEVPVGHIYHKGIDTSMSIDQSLHSLFGCSKASADLYVQEYSRYFGMKTVVLRGGCLTGSGHRGAKLHGFLSYLIKTAVEGNSYTVFGYKGKQVRDNLHATDIGRLISKIYDKSQSESPPVFPVVANLGGGRDNAVSVLEVINTLKDSFDLKLSFDVSSTARVGDHKWYITDNSFLSKEFSWRPTQSVSDIIQDILTYS